MSKKGGKGKKKGGDDGEEKELERMQVLNFKVNQLKIKTVSEQERADKARASETELRGRIMELDKDLKNEKLKLYSITADMTRQFKQMQEELVNKVNKLEQIKVDKKEELEKKTKDYEQMCKDNDLALTKKDNEIQDQKKKIEEMSAEFAKMLKDTLSKMKERIEKVQWDSDADTKAIQQLKQSSGGIQQDGPNK